MSDVARSDHAAERALIDGALRRFRERHLAGVPGAVGEAIDYSLQGEGKRFRGVLFLAAYRACGGTGDASGLAAAIEVVHAYSLVHDDLPCMDDDDVRRGRPTVHKVFGVAAATAAGVAMVPLAARCVLDGARELRVDDALASRMVGELMSASGAGGMVGGQLMDLDGEAQPLGLADLERIHGAKTGALIVACARLGALAAGADADRLAALTAYGRAIGLAFQIADDVLDLTASSATLGKTAGRDLVLHKSTYPALLGIDGATHRAEALVADACDALDAAGLRTPDLEALAHFIVERRS